MDMAKAQQTLERVQDAAAYSVAVGTASVPLWMSEMTNYGQFLLLCLSIIIASATAIIQIRRAWRGKE